jgi:deoxyribose-phosphate aldolase
MQTNTRVPHQRLVSVLDATLLDDDVDSGRMHAFLKRLDGSGVAAVCVQAPWVAMAQDLLKGQCAIASVVNFPEGYGGPDDAGEEALSLARAGVDEIDVVVPIDTLAHDDGLAIRWTVEAVREAAPQAVIKAILETGALADQRRVAQAAGAAIAGGADFLKTSTGRHAIGATPESVATLLRVMLSVPGKIGLKVSGGISTLDAATDYWCQTEESMGAQWCHKKRFRIGASKLLDHLL